MNEIRFVFPGDPVPAARPRRSANGGMYTPDVYRTYKEALSWGLKMAYRDQAQEVPSSLVPRERAKYIKANRLMVFLDVYRRKDTGDGDNYDKTVRDAVQDSGLIANDCQIKFGATALLINKDNPRIEFVMVPIVGQVPSAIGMYEYRKEILCE